MLTALLHSSKTMRPRLPATTDATMYQAPAFLNEARLLHTQLSRLDTDDLRSSMQLSADKAEQTKRLIAGWSYKPEGSQLAIDAFLGDIYSGLQVRSFDAADRAYANEHLLILSGLYGGLRALDSIQPYRLEMGYKVPLEGYKNLYQFWGDKIARLIPAGGTVVNLSAVEYTKAVLPYVSTPVVTPKFMTISPKTGQPAFVTVHAKIVRGAFAHWMIRRRIDAVKDIPQFNELGYRYDAAASTPDQPVFICQHFEGIGLSVRLT